MKISILLENGLFLQAKGFGADGTSVGEIVFNTSMTGYQEIITDPSYAGQFVVFTASEIGTVGVNDDDMESRGAWLKGVIVRNYNPNYSNFRAQQSLHSFLQKHNILGISDIDTRFLTKLIRNEGSQMMIASSKIHSKEELKKLLDEADHISQINYIKEVTTPTMYIHNQGAWNDETLSYNEPNTSKTIAVYDFGVKRNILNELTNVGLKCEVYPAHTPASELIRKYQNNEIMGVFLSNGPGDPLVLHDVKANIQQLIQAKIPMFGICLGHQLLSIAHGYDTFKLKFGHHGGNHPVKKTSVEITAQNHNYNVPEAIKEIAEITHMNLFDNTIEGVRYKNEPIFSVQHHPEASPGPRESKYIFKEFADMLG
ncbi:MAG: glutamine-hydrolyzing carbamoyl-phosphate synthase small subunit [Epsilonproteobacteria bacterium]|nr:glutamine-hydrolyzing carbamoyl-phosphate synthase small subunit [Campylobacterota bacterium]